MLNCSNIQSVGHKIEFIKALLYTGLTAVTSCVETK